MVYSASRGDPGEPYAWCFARKAAASFRMSRSVHSSGFLFAQPDQLLALGGGEARASVRAIGACLTHSRTAVSVRSMSRATAPTVLRYRAPSEPRRALNSSVKWRRACRLAVSPSV